MLHSPFGSKRFHIVLHNYTVEEASAIEEFYNDFASYYVIGKEIAPQMKVKHLQMYVEFTKAYNFQTVKHMFPLETGKRIHIEVAKKSKEHNSFYCMKDKYFVTNTINTKFQVNKLMKSHEVLERTERTIRHQMKQDYETCQMK